MTAAPPISIMVNRLRYKHWSLLVALDDTGNLHQAAATINIAQPSASRMLAGIEETLGFSLFERRSRGLHPTALGAATLAYARGALASLERFSENLQQQCKGGFGQLTIGAIMGAAPDLLAAAVAELKLERPLLNVRILGETSDQIVDLLQKGRVDVALGRFTDSMQHNEFDFEPVANETLHLVVRADHPLCHESGCLALDRLTRWPWILQPITSPARQIFEEELMRSRICTPANVVECGSIFATLQLLQNNDAIAMLPEPVIRDYVNAGLLTALPIEIGRNLTGYGILLRKHEDHSEAVTRFISLLRRHSAAQQRQVHARRAAPPSAPSFAMFHGQAAMLDAPESG